MGEDDADTYAVDVDKNEDNGWRYEGDGVTGSRRDEVEDEVHKGEDDEDKVAEEKDVGKEDDAADEDDEYSESADDEDVDDVMMTMKLTMLRIMTLYLNM